MATKKKTEKKKPARRPAKPAKPRRPARPAKKTAPRKKSPAVKKARAAKKAVPKAKPIVARTRLSPAVKTKRKMEGIEKALRLSTTKPKASKLPVQLELEDIVTHASGGEADEVSITESKFNIGVRHNAQALAMQELPQGYGKDCVALLVVDPRFVFTYWEVNQKTLAHLMGKAGPGAKLTLRFYDTTGSANLDSSPSWDVEVFDRLGNWYLKLTHPEQRLCLDIGIRTASGEFFRIARSNVMKMPAETLARPGPIRWMVVTPAGDKLISDVEDYTDADLELLKKILGPYFFDLLMRGRFASIAGSSIEAIFYEVSGLNAGGSPAGRPPWSAA